MFTQGFEKTSSDMKIGPPKGKKETPEEKKKREAAEQSSLGC